jgi:hypothetical protein
MTLKKLGFLIALTSISATTFASSQYASVDPAWDFRSSSNDTDSHFSSPSDFGNINPFGTNNQLNGSVDGIDLSITAWSSSLHNGVASCKDSQRQDLCIQSVKLTRYKSGLGIINGDERNDTPNHSVDNNNQDYDMVLLSFSEKVNISNLYTGWNYAYTDVNGSNESRTQGGAGASIMAYTGGNITGNLPFSTTDTWESITHQGWNLLDADTKRNGRVSSNGQNLDVLPVTSTGVYSKFWLVGAAHSVLRDAGHITDHIKIAGVDFVKQNTPNVPVNAPGILALFGAGAFFLLKRKK